MSPRTTSSPLLRIIVVNVFIIAGLVMVQRSGKLTGAMIGFYVFFFSWQTRSCTSPHAHGSV